MEVTSLSEWELWEPVVTLLLFHGDWKVCIRLASPSAWVSGCLWWAEPPWALTGFESKWKINLCVKPFIFENYFCSIIHPNHRNKITFEKSCLRWIINQIVTALLSTSAAPPSSEQNPKPSRLRRGVLPASPTPHLLSCPHSLCSGTRSPPYCPCIFWALGHLRISALTISMDWNALDLPMVCPLISWRSLPESYTSSVKPSLTLRLRSPFPFSFIFYWTRQLLESCIKGFWI